MDQRHIPVLRFEFRVHLVSFSALVNLVEETI